MQFQRELGPSIFDELVPFIHLHYEEIAHYKDIPLNPDWERYKTLEANGTLRAFTARDDYGNLLGYAVFFLAKNMHYKSSLQASQDILFIHPKHRGFGAKFIKWCDEELKAEGVQAVYHHVKQAHNFGPLLERFGYELVDLIYARRLG